jgi:hypothetical protein
MHSIAYHIGILHKIIFRTKLQQTISLQYQSFFKQPKLTTGLKNAFHSAKIPSFFPEHDDQPPSMDNSPWTTAQPPSQA